MLQPDYARLQELLLHEMHHDPSAMLMQLSKASLIDCVSVCTISLERRQQRRWTIPWATGECVISHGVCVCHTCHMYMRHMVTALRTSALLWSKASKRPGSKSRLCSSGSRSALDILCTTRPMLFTVACTHARTLSHTQRKVSAPGCHTRSLCTHKQPQVRESDRHVTVPSKA